MGRVEAVAAALRRDPADRDGWVALAAAVDRQGTFENALLELLDEPGARPAAAAALAGAPKAQGLAGLLLASRGLEARPLPGPLPEAWASAVGSSEGSEAFDPTSGMPLAARGRGTGRLPYLWVPLPEGGVYLGARPLRVIEFQRLRPAACPDPPAWEEQRRAPNRPVVLLSWEQAVLFAAAQGARLPRVEERLRATCGGPPRVRPEVPVVADLTPMERPPAAPHRWQEALSDAGAGAPGPYGHRGLRGNVRDWCLDPVELAEDPAALGRAVVGVDWTRAGALVEDLDLTEAEDQRYSFATVGLRLAVDPLAVAPRP